MKTNYPKISYNTIKRNENKAFWRKKKNKIKQHKSKASLLEQIGLVEFWMKAH